MLREQLAALNAEEDGWTLTELAITGMVTAIVIGIFLTALVSLQGMLSGQTQRSANNDNTRLAIQQMDRQIRSGNLLYNPEISGDPAQTGIPDLPARYSVLVYTQSNADYRCVQWRVSNDRRLEKMSWVPGNGIPPDENQKTGWETIVENVVNRSLDPQVPAFTLTEPMSEVGRTLNVAILVNGRLERSPEQTVRVDVALTGRNTTRGFPVDACRWELPAS